MTMNEQIQSHQAARVAVILPCYNEEAAITAVLDEFRQALPQVPVFVFDNASTDRTAELARAGGATVLHVAHKGKGNVVARMFADVDADVYVMVDGDATYDVTDIQAHIDMLLAQRLDMVVGRRCDDGTTHTYRAGHRFGNAMLTGAVTQLFGGKFDDMLSGYRVFSRRYVKSFPVMPQGFEIETELTVHALELRMPWAEVSTVYRARPEGSESKLSTYRDGWRILRTIGRLFINERPLQIFGIAFVVLLLLSLGLTVPLILTYLDTGLVPRFPTLIFSVGLLTLSLMSLVFGVLLHAITLSRREVRRLAYLAVPAWHGPRRAP